VLATAAVAVGDHPRGQGPATTTCSEGPAQVLAQEPGVLEKWLCCCMSHSYHRGGKHSCCQPYRCSAHCFAQAAQEAALQSIAILAVGQPLCGGSMTATVWQLGANGPVAATVCWLCGGCVAAVWRLCGGCAAAVWRLCGGCAAAVWRLCGGCTQRLATSCCDH
jgi:hypothetical protein